MILGSGVDGRKQTDIFTSAFDPSKRDVWTRFLCTILAAPLNIPYTAAGRVWNARLRGEGVSEDEKEKNVGEKSCKLQMNAHGHCSMEADLCDHSPVLACSALVRGKVRE